MAGRQTKRETVQFVELVNKVNSEANMLIERAKYEGSGDEKVKVSDHKSTMVPFSYFQIVDGKIDTLRRLQSALADVVENGHYPLTALVADVNYGLEHRARSDYAAGIDPSMTPAQRQAVDNIRPLVESGILALDIAMQALVKTGMTPEQIATYLAADKPE